MHKPSFCVEEVKHCAHKGIRIMLLGNPLFFLFLATVSLSVFVYWVYFDGSATAELETSLAGIESENVISIVMLHINSCLFKSLFCVCVKLQKHHF